MDEQEFDSFFRQPFRTEDAMQADTLFRRCTTLAVALWAGIPAISGVNCSRRILKYLRALISPISGSWNDKLRQFQPL
jgi:hypothetical protein